jgi:hypothetical protein
MLMRKLSLIKIGPMTQNPGKVLCHILMVWLLSQVMDNAIGNVVNMIILLIFKKFWVNLWRPTKKVDCQFILINIFQLCGQFLICHQHQSFEARDLKTLE